MTFLPRNTVNAFDCGLNKIRSSCMQCPCARFESCVRYVVYLRANTWHTQHTHTRHKIKRTRSSCGECENGERSREKASSINSKCVSRGMGHKHLSHTIINLDCARLLLAFQMTDFIQLLVVVFHSFYFACHFSLSCNRHHSH